MATRFGGSKNTSSYLAATSTHFLLHMSRHPTPVLDALCILALFVQGQETPDKIVLGTKEMLTFDWGLHCPRLVQISGP